MGWQMKYDAYKRRDDRETLERIKRWPSLRRRFSYVRIYSAEWDAFWRGTGQGYTDYPESSAVLTIDEALEKAGHCCSKKRIQFVKVEEVAECEK